MRRWKFQKNEGKSKSPNEFFFYQDADFIYEIPVESSASGESRQLTEVDSRNVECVCEFLTNRLRVAQQNSSCSVMK